MPRHLQVGRGVNLHPFYLSFFVQFVQHRHLHLPLEVLAVDDCLVKAPGGLLAADGEVHRVGPPNVHPACEPFCPPPHPPQKKKQRRNTRTGIF